MTANTPATTAAPHADSAVETVLSLRAWWVERDDGTGCQVVAADADAAMASSLPVLGRAPVSATDVTDQVIASQQGLPVPALGTSSYLLQRVCRSSSLQTPPPADDGVIDLEPA